VDGSGTGAAGSSTAGVGCMGVVRARTGGVGFVSAVGWFAISASGSSAGVGFDPTASPGGRGSLASTGASGCVSVGGAGAATGAVWAVGGGDGAAGGAAVSLGCVLWWLGGLEFSVLAPNAHQASSPTPRTTPPILAC
jgi:hypothetical protein